jgi:hypothetical protein
MGKGRDGRVEGARSEEVEHAVVLSSTLDGEPAQRVRGRVTRLNDIASTLGHFHLTDRGSYTVTYLI